VHRSFSKGIRILKKDTLQNGYAKRGQTLFLLSFVVLIASGTLLLCIPGMYKGGNLEFMDALFTSTSAVCVTGLASKPICNFSFCGQLVILLLIQAGGLGIMTLSASILLALGKGLSFSNALMVSNLNDNFSLRNTESLLRTVMNYTFITEGVGFVLILISMLFSADWSGGFWQKLLETLWNSLFLSVSSFCNSGMTTFPDSLENVNRAAQLFAALLAITGGLGVYVIYDLIQKCLDRSHRLRVHSKLVLLATAILLIGGTVSIYFLSRENSLHPFDAFCFAVTSRTCGWNTAPMSKLSPAATIFIMLLMLIGGSPGSTAGGIKTSTVALALAGIVSALRGDPETIVFKRRIPAGIVLRAQTIIIIFAVLSVIGAVTLATTEKRLDLAPGTSINKLSTLAENASTQGTTFEAVSALTTTGLSIKNTTSQLSTKGKGLLVLFMFLGRVGPFSVLLFLMSRERRGQLKYPEERIIIG